MEEVQQSFIEGLLTKDPKLRLGANGVQEIKNHPFFAGINWQDIIEKKVDPPIKPVLNSTVCFLKFFCFWTFY